MLQLEIAVGNNDVRLNIFREGFKPKHDDSNPAIRFKVPRPAIGLSTYRDAKKT